MASEEQIEWARKINAALDYEPVFAKRTAIIAAALSAAEQQGDGWRPIETAPKDGTEILGIQVHDGRASSPGIVAWSREDEWWDIDADQYGYPTHWQHISLPAPPTKGDSNVG